MRDRNFHDTRSRRCSPPYRNFHYETRRSGSRRFEPERSRVSPVRRAERVDDRPDHHRSGNVNIARYSDSVARDNETASSKFEWNNLLDAKQLQNATSSTMTKNHIVSGFSYGFSGSGTVSPNGPPRSYGGFVSLLKENEVSLRPPMHWEHQQHQHVGYGVPVSQPNASLASSSSSCFGGSLGFCRSAGIGADGYFAGDVHGQMPKPNYQYCSIQVMNGDLSYSEMQRSEKNDGIPFSNGKFMPPEFQRPSIVDSIVEKIDGVLVSRGDPSKKEAPWEEDEHFIAPKCIDLTQQSKHCVEPLGCRNVHPEYGTDGDRDGEGWSLRGYEKNAYTSDYQGGWKGLPVLENDQYVYKQGGVSDDGAMKTEKLAMHDLDMEMFELKYGGNADENQFWTDFNAGLPRCHKQCEYDTFEDEDASFEEGIMRVQFNECSKSPYSPVPVERSSRKLQMIIGKSMKKKSRPARTIPLPSSSVSSGRNVHARLGPRVFPAEDPYNAAKYIKSKKLKRSLCDFSRTAPCSDPSDVKVKVKHTKRSKIEPPEDSKEFKQLVQNAFFKFVKLLNENPSQRRKYIDQGGIDTLRCTLCGRSVSSSA